MNAGIETTYTPPRWIAFAQAARPVLAFIGLMLAALAVCVVAVVLAVMPDASLNTVVTASVLVLAALLCAGVPGAVVAAMAVYFAKRNADTVHEMAVNGRLAVAAAPARQTIVEAAPLPAPVVPARMEIETPKRMAIPRDERLRETAERARRVLMSAKLQPTQANLREMVHGCEGGEAASELQQWMAAAGWCASSGSGSAYHWIDGDKLAIPTSALPRWVAGRVAEKSYPVAG